MPFVERKASSSKPRPVSGGNNGKSKQDRGKPRPKSNLVKRQRGNDELRELEDKIANFVPPAEVTAFAQLPLSTPTLRGLKSSHFLTPTPVQSLSIPHSLRGHDLLGSAKTGSGKTLAFLIPLLERLYLHRWGPMDGLGAVVISPTRELAVQTFGMLRDVGRHHNFSAGLVIGGKSLKEERDRLGRMNILICTPGRLLQHLDSTVGFESASLKMLVLDEADRLLDLGFLPILKAIVSHFNPAVLPSGRPERQTLLFSATQSKDIGKLAQLSLHDPMFINCNKPGEEGVVPASLEQFYAVIPLERKLDALWGFVKSHLKMKGLVFVTSGKQVRFVFETFKRLHPGLPLLHLHGKQKQATRLSIFQRFSSASSALLISTDVAARGLDFPAIDWVIQLDCPEDVDTYIHRIGRTARYQSEGKALLFLCPSEEEGMKKRWEEKSIQIKNIKIKQSKMGDLKQQMQNFAFKEPEIKYLGQRAFISYMRAVHLMKDKEIFKLEELSPEAYAASMGLPGAPQIKLGNDGPGKQSKSVGPPQPTVVHVASTGDTRSIASASDEESEEEEDTVLGGAEESIRVASGGSSAGVTDGSDDSAPEEEAEEAASGSGTDSDEQQAVKANVRTKYDRMFERKNQSILAPHYSSLIAHDEDRMNGEGDGDDDEVFTMARRDHALSDDEADGDALLASLPHGNGVSMTSATSADKAENLSKRALKQGTSRKAQLRNRPVPDKIVFDETTGEARNFYEEGADVEQSAGGKERRADFVREEQEKMRAADQVDREVARERRREKKRKRKEREREAREQDLSGDEGGGVAVLGGGSDAEFSEGEGELPDEPERVAKRGKRGGVAVDRPASGLEDEEALALRLLQG